MEFLIHVSSQLCVSAGREGVNNVIVWSVRTSRREIDQAGNGGKSDDRGGSDVQYEIFCIETNSNTRS